LNLNFKIAFSHPSPACRDIKIFFGSDMPHLVKKVRNAMDNKSQELIFRDSDVSLRPLEEIWMVSQTPGSYLCGNHLAVDHFQLDAYKKMRGFLAVQVMSQTARKTIIKYCDNTDGVTEEDYHKGCLIFLIRLID
jgi:hypothetical protein